MAAVEDLDDLVELAAEEARVAVGADTLSISRWEADARVLRVIVNAGELAAWEERRPSDETYRLDDDDALRLLLLEGRSYTTSLDDPDAFAAEAELLRQVGKHSCVAVPIMLGGSAWGELWAAREEGLPGFGPRDVRFLETIAGQIAAAVGRTELYARMADLAFKDPLTGVGNRRALEERLELCAREARASGGDVAVLLGDLDNLKELNDALGHARGDQALAAVAAALTAETDETGADRTVYRLGGDEFCLLLARGTAEEAHAAGERAIARLAAGPAPAVSASFGVASLGLGDGRTADLLRAADHALYIAKRTGRKRVCVADASHDAVWGVVTDRDFQSSPQPASRRGSRSGRPPAPFPARPRPRALRLRAVPAAPGSGRPISAVPSMPRAPRSRSRPRERGSISTYWTINLRAGRTWSKGAGPGEDEYTTEDYPQTARILRAGGSFVVSADDPDGDPGEIDLLRSFRNVGTPGGGGSDRRGQLARRDLFRRDGGGARGSRARRAPARRGSGAAPHRAGRGASGRRRLSPRTVDGHRPAGGPAAGASAEIPQKELSSWAMKPNEALAELLDLSSQIEDAAVLGESGFVLASSGTPERGEQLARIAADLVAAAADVRPTGEVTRVEVALGAGSVFVVAGRSAHGRRHDGARADRGSRRLRPPDGAAPARREARPQACAFEEEGCGRCVGCSSSLSSAACAWWFVARRREEPVRSATIGHADGSSVTLDEGSPELDRLLQIAAEALPA